MDNNNDIDIRPVPVDRLEQFGEPELEKRAARVAVLLASYQERVAESEKALEMARSIFRFLEEEDLKVKLAQDLKKGNVVRVVCPSCQGSGLKPVDATSGQIQKKSAFENVGSNTMTTKPQDVDSTERCSECEGRCWLLMDRFKG